jgi:hypothetical protein
MNNEEYLYPHRHRHVHTTVLDNLSSNLHSLQTRLQQYFSPIRDLLTSPNGMDNIVAVIACIIIFFVSFKILGYLSRIILYWLSWVFTIVLWGGVMLMAWYTYTVGVERALQGAGRVWGFVVWFAEAFLEGMGGEQNQAGQRYGTGHRKGGPKNKYGNAHTWGYGGRGRG